MTKSTEKFNLSRIAIQNPAITTYLLIVLMLAGVASFFQLGQDEDPPFTFRAMVVRAFWPGATSLQVSEQLTDKLEEILQEAPHVDKIRSYSKAGETTIFIEVKDSVTAKEIQHIWYTIRKKINDKQHIMMKQQLMDYINQSLITTCNYMSQLLKLIKNNRVY
mgnify:CR=1 FL=1